MYLCLNASLNPYGITQSTSDEENLKKKIKSILGNDNVKTFAIEHFHFYNYDPHLIAKKLTGGGCFRIAEVAV